MTLTAITTIECLVEDFGWEAVVDELVEIAATASEDRLDEVKDLLDAAIAISEGKGQASILSH